MKRISRDLFLFWCLKAANERIPYIWGGKDPVLKDGAMPFKTGGLDCSGFVTFPLFLLGGDDLRPTHNTDRIWTEFPRIQAEQVRPGDLVLYRGESSMGPDDVEHVMVFAGTASDTEHGIVVGQAYGGKANTSVDYSIRNRCWTKVLGLRYRNDVAGFVRPPFVS